MPAYEYRCRVCDTSFEVRRSITATAPGATPCPDGHTATSRVFSAVAVGAGVGAGPAGALAAPAAGGKGCCGGGCCG